MVDNTERARAVQERMTQRRAELSLPTRFGRSVEREVPEAVPRRPLSKASRVAAEAAWRRYGGGEISRFERDRGPAL